MRFTLNDATYAYEIYGEGEVLLLLHGFTGSKQTWQSFVEIWKKSFQVITIDLPGHGKTVTQTVRSMEACCHDIDQLLTYLQIEKVHLIGYSMGGRTALSFALLYPEKVKTLILESASPGLKQEADRELRRTNDEKLAKRIETEGLSAFVHFWENIPLFATQKKLPEQIKQKIYQERIAQTEAGLANSLRHMGTGSQPSWWENLSKLTIPVLLIVGELDTKFVTINKMMQKFITSATLEVVPDAGHAVHIEQAEIFDRLIRMFISRKQ